MSAASIAPLAAVRRFFFAEISYQGENGMNRRAALFLAKVEFRPDERG